MAQTKLIGTVIKSGSVPTTALGGGVISSSNQLASALPASVVSSSAQVTAFLPGGTVSSSAQLPAGTVSSSAQVQANLPSPLYSSSAQLIANINSQTLTPQSIYAQDTISGLTGSFVSGTYSTALGIGILKPSCSLHISGTTMIQQVIERVSITGSAPPAAVNLDIASGSILFYSGSTNGYWTVNFRGDIATTLNSIMYPGQSLTTIVIVNHGATPYSASSYTIDGKSFTPLWQNGSVPSASGNSTDFYSYTIFKIASASYNLFASQIKYSL